MVADMSRTTLAIFGLAAAAAKDRRNFVGTAFGGLGEEGERQVFGLVFQEDGIGVAQASYFQSVGFYFVCLRAYLRPYAAAHYLFFQRLCGRAVSLAREVFGEAAAYRPERAELPDEPFVGRHLGHERSAAPHLSDPSVRFEFEQRASGSRVADAEFGY